VLRSRSTVAILARFQERIVERLLCLRRQLQGMAIPWRFLVRQPFAQRLRHRLARSRDLIDEHRGHPVVARREREEHVRELDRAMIAARGLVVRRAKHVPRAASEVVDQRHSVR
jgi:hypothetical protein